MLGYLGRDEELAGREEPDGRDAALDEVLEGRDTLPPFDSLPVEVVGREELVEGREEDADGRPVVDVVVGRLVDDEGRVDDDDEVVAPDLGTFVSLPPTLDVGRVVLLDGRVVEDELDDVPLVDGRPLDDVLLGLVVEVLRLVAEELEGRDVPGTVAGRVPELGRVPLLPSVVVPDLGVEGFDDEVLLGRCEFDTGRSKLPLVLVPAAFTAGVVVVVGRLLDGAGRVVAVVVSASTLYCGRSLPGVYDPCGTCGASVGRRI